MSVDVDTRTLLHGGLNAAMMAAFQSEEGKPIGMGLAVLMGFIEVMFPKHSDPVKDPAATPRDVEEALNGMAQNVINAIWQKRAADVKTSINALTSEFYNEWSGLTGVPDPKTGVLKGGVHIDTTQFIMADAKGQPLDSQTVSDYYSYFNFFEPAGALTLLRQYRNTLQISSLNDQSLTSVQVADHQTQNIGLYGLIGSLTAAYLHASVAWIWGRELLKAWQYSEFQKALEDWNTQGQPYPYSQLLQKFPGVNDNPYYQPVDWNSFIDLPGSPVHLLINEVQDMLDFCVTVPGQNGQPDQPGLYTSMVADWDLFDTTIAGYDVTFKASVTKADMIAMVEQGTDRSGKWHTLDAQYTRLANVTEDNLSLFGQVIDQWRAMAATVRFKVYVTVAGDTLETVCDTFYGDRKYLYDLVWANKKAWWNRSFPKKPWPLDAGMILKIFEVDALPYVTN